jgi:hypothetical protein
MMLTFCSHSSQGLLGPEIPKQLSHAGSTSLSPKGMILSTLHHLRCTQTLTGFELYFTSNGPMPELAGQEEPFPEPDNQSKMKRSCENAEHVGKF